MKTLFKVSLIFILVTSLSTDEAKILNATILDFQVNENLGIGVALQHCPSIATDSSGNFIITWMDDRNGDQDIYAQRFSNDGIALEKNFKVNDDISNTWQNNPSISADNSGNFIITWVDSRNSNSSPPRCDIYAQRYSSDGTALGNNFQVNENTEVTNEGGIPYISADRSGNFIITWDDERNGNYDIYTQRYSSDGTPLGSNFKVNDDAGSEGQRSPCISADSIGNFIITWMDGRNDSRDIYAQRYSSDGTALNNNFKVNDDQGSSDQRFSSISADDSGNFIITWADERNGDLDIYAQRYSSEGAAVDSNFKVNDDQGFLWQLAPSISADNSGNFIITWQKESYDIYAQRYTNDGTALDSNFQVNNVQGFEWPSLPSISSDVNGNFIITWADGRNISSSFIDIYAQRYSSEGAAFDSNFVVNDDQGNATQENPRISVDGGGNFIITWKDYCNGNADIYAQRYAIDGTTLGSNFKVNDDQGSGKQYYPFISADDSGNFIILWEDDRSGKWDIYAQLYSSDGTALGSNFKVNDDQGSDNQIYPSISADDKGNFIITRTDDRNGDDDIYAQRYSSDGTTVGSYFKVNVDMGSAGQESPSISAYGSGSFIITFTDSRNGDITDIYAQRYSNDGTALGSNFKVNDDAGIAWQVYPVVSADSSGNFNIIWIDKREGDYFIYVQRYANDGTALGSNFKVNVYLSNPWHSDHSISTDANGNFIIIWKDEQNGDLDIFAQRFLNDGTALGDIFRLTNTSEGVQYEPDVKLWNGRIYNTWTDSRDGGPRYDIWANVLDWNDPNPTGISYNFNSQIPTEFVLYQNYPNPFNPSTTIKFTLPKSEFVTLKIYNILGKEIATVVNSKLQVGNYTYEFDGSHLASGVYLYIVEAGDFQDVKKMILLR